MKNICRSLTLTQNPVLLRGRCTAMRFILILLLAACGGTQLLAQMIVVPNELADKDGNTFGTTPAGTDNAGVRVMYMHDAAQFQALSGPAYLIGFTFRPDQTLGPSGPRTGVFKIYVSTSPRSMAQFSARFSDNIGADNTLVFDGTMTFTTANQPGPGNTRQFDQFFRFSTPFLYDPSAGNLVVDVRIFQGEGPAIRYDAVAGSPVLKAVFAPGAPSGTQGQFDTAVPIIQLTFESAPVLTIRPSEVEVCWNSVSNATYRVEWRSEVSNGVWTPLVDCVRSTDSTTCIQDAMTPGSPRKFYRVVPANCTP